MVGHKFDKEYDVLLFAVSSLLDQFKNEERLFAAQCIWLLASIIQYTEILIFY